MSNILGDLIHSVGGRLTLSTGVPVPTSDVTAATTIYFTPYKGNAVPLYDTTANVWTYLEFSEISLSLSGFTASKNSDAFVYNNSGTLALERVEWTNDTTRATAIALQDGRWTKSGDASRLYVGTFRTTASTGQCEDSLTSRFVWNYYNRVPRRFYLTEATSHNYSTATWRAWNNTTTGTQAKYVCGYYEDPLTLGIRANIYNSSAANNVITAVAQDSSTFSDNTYPVARTHQTGSAASPTGFAVVPSALGYHYLQVVEYASAATGTFVACYLTGSILG